MTSDAQEGLGKVASQHASSASAASAGQQDAPLPPAGPHARPELMNPDATPGTGALPPIGVAEDPNEQPTS